MYIINFFNNHSMINSGVLVDSTICLDRCVELELTVFQEMEQMFLECLGVTIPCVTLGNIILKDILISPKEMRDNCKTIISIINNHINCFYQKDAIRIIDKIKYASEQNYYTVIVVVPDTYKLNKK